MSVMRMGKKRPDGWRNGHNPSLKPSPQNAQDRREVVFIFPFLWNRTFVPPAELISFNATLTYGKYNLRTYPKIQEEFAF